MSSAQYNALKVADLKELLQQRGLSTSGTKPSLISRLEEADAQAGNGDVQASANAQASETQTSSEGTAKDPSSAIADTSNSPENGVSGSASASTAGTTNNEEPPAVADAMAGLSNQELVLQELETRASRARKMDEALADDIDRKIKRIKKFGVPDAPEVKDILRQHGRLPPLESKSKAGHKQALKDTKKPAQEPAAAVAAAPLVDEETLAKRRQRFA